MSIVLVIFFWNVVITMHCAEKSYSTTFCRHIWKERWQWRKATNAWQRRSIVIPTCDWWNIFSVLLYTSNHCHSESEWSSSARLVQHLCRTCPSLYCCQCYRRVSLDHIPLSWYVLPDLGQWRSKDAPHRVQWIGSMVLEHLTTFVEGFHTF